MFGTLATMGLIMGGIDMAWKKSHGNGELEEVKKRWDLAMVGAGFKNKGDLNQSPDLLKIIKKEYGYDCIVSLPAGLSFDKFDENKNMIKSSMKCEDVHFEWVKTKGCMYMRLINLPFDDSKPFEPVAVQPNEVYLGTTQFFKDVVSNLGIYPHILVSGATGTGKSVFIFMLLMNLIANHAEENMNVYLAQISDKKDLRLFQDCEQTKYYAPSLEEATKMYTHLVWEMTRRNNLINKYYDVNNIGDYNKKFPKQKLPYIYIFADEFSFYMEDDTDDNKTIFLKQQCNSLIARLVKQSRSAGMFLVVGLQRPDKENMPPIFKSQMCTRVALAQSNTASSLVVIDDGEAVNLEHREAIILLGAKRFKIKVPYIDMELIQAYVADHAIPESHYIDLSGYNHIITTAENWQPTKGGGSKKGGNKPQASGFNNVTEMHDIMSDKKENSKGRGKGKGVIG